MLVQYVEAQEDMIPKGWFGWRQLDLIMGLVPCLLFTYPVYSFLREYAARRNPDYWQPALYADESGDRYGNDIRMYTYVYVYIVYI